MNRPILVCALFVAATAMLGAQEASQSNPYQGTSNPPPDDTIVTSSTPQAKPPAGRVETESQARPTFRLMIQCPPPRLTRRPGIRLTQRQAIRRLAETTISCRWCLTMRRNEA
jgi:hypothetical protein